MVQTICVIGLGYIGLPTASMFATHGYKVHGVDVNQDLVSMINCGRSYIDEPGLNTLVRAAVFSKNLIAHNKPSSADAYIICVPTPLDPIKNVPNMNYVREAAESIVPYLKKESLVVLESTSPLGTTENLLVPILEKSGLKAGKDIFVAHCPERVLPGKILTEMVENDRIIGGINEESAKRIKNMYQSFVGGNIYLTDSKTAELCKLMENTYRDVNIALANELAIISEKLGINVWEAIKLANKHPRVNILSPGPGVGGHCIPIDPWFIVETAPEDAKLIRLSRNINDEMVIFVTGMIKEIIGNKGAVSIFGAAYKGNVDDARESPTLRLVELLSKAGCDIRVCDPHVQRFKYELQDIESSVLDSDCIVLMSDHDEFKNLTLDEIRDLGKKMKQKHLIDTRNCLDHELWKSADFSVRILGNGKEVRI